MAEMVQKEKGGDVATVERTRTGTTYVPRCDIVETEDALFVYGDLPGVKPEDLDVRFEDERLVLHGTVEPRHEEREFVYGEYGIGDFYREFQVFEDVDVENISADLKDGVLCVRLPKSEAAKPRKIEVKTD